MKTIQILGTGCAKCKLLAEHAEAAAKALGIEHEIVKVTQIPEIMKFGVMMTPALAAFILGLVFGIAIGPCTFAYMAPMLGVTFRLARTNPAYGALLLLMYGVGHCGVIVLAGTFTGVVQQYLNWTEKSRGTLILKNVCGVLVLVGGLYLIYTAQ